MLLILTAMARKQTAVSDEDSGNGPLPTGKRPVFEARVTDDNGHTSVKISWRNDARLRVIAKRLVWWIIVPTAITIAALREMGIL